MTDKTNFQLKQECIDEILRQGGTFREVFSRLKRALFPGPFPRREDFAFHVDSGKQTAEMLYDLQLACLRAEARKGKAAAEAPNVTENLVESYTAAVLRIKELEEKLKLAESRAKGEEIWRKRVEEERDAWCKARHETEKMGERRMDEFREDHRVAKGKWEEKLNAALARVAELEAAQQWQPIAEAPKDTWVAVREPGSTQWYEATFDSYDANWYDGFGNKRAPTHFFPVPKPPKEES